MYTINNFFILIKCKVLCKIVIFHEKLFMKCCQHPTNQQQWVCKLEAITTCKATLIAMGQMPTTSLNKPIGH